MLLRVAKWDDVERMPAFEREFHFEEAAKIFRNDEGVIVIPR